MLLITIAYMAANNVAMITGVYSKITPIHPIRFFIEFTISLLNHRHRRSEIPPDDVDTWMQDRCHRYFL